MNYFVDLKDTRKAFKFVLLCLFLHFTNLWLIFSSLCVSFDLRSVFHPEMQRRAEIINVFFMISYQAYNAENHR